MGVGSGGDNAICNHAYVSGGVDVKPKTLAKLLRTGWVHVTDGFGGADLQLVSSTDKTVLNIDWDDGFGATYECIELTPSELRAIADRLEELEL